MDSLKQKILADIQKTGFASELNTITVLTDNGWKSEHGRTYEDKDENRSREIDIVAWKVLYDADLGFRLTFYLVIEIKKSERPWIIFTTQPTMRPELGWRVMNQCTNIYEWKISTKSEKGGYFSSIFDYDTVTKNSLRSGASRVGKAFHEFNKNPSDKSKIYEALISSCKAAFYLNSAYESEEIKNLDLDKEVDVQIVLPIVIVDGLLFEVFNDSSGNIDAVETNYIPVEFPYSSTNYRRNDFDMTFFPDIIRYEHLNIFLQNIERWRITMKKEMQQKLRSLGKRPSKTYLDLLKD